MKTTYKRAVMVYFENYYCKIQKQLVIGTINEQRAINAVKKHQYPRRCCVKETEVFNNIDAVDVDFDLDYAIIL